jgi:hypothetical protein
VYDASCCKLISDCRIYLFIACSAIICVILYHIFRRVQFCTYLEFPVLRKIDFSVAVYTASVTRGTELSISFVVWIWAIHLVFKLLYNLFNACFFVSISTLYPSHWTRPRTGNVTGLCSEWDAKLDVFFYDETLLVKITKSRVSALVGLTSAMRVRL